MSNQRFDCNFTWWITTTQSIYQNHRKNKWEDAMAINAMFSLVQHSSFPITIQYCFKFSKQLSSHRYPEKHLNRFLISFSIWTMTSSLICSSPIPSCQSFSSVPCNLKFHFDHKENTLNQVWYGATDTMSWFPSEVQASRFIFFCAEWKVCSQNCLEITIFLKCKLIQSCNLFPLLITNESVFQDRQPRNFQCLFHILF